MPQSFIVLPMFAMVVLSFVTLARLFYRRSRSVALGDVDAKYFRTYQNTTAQAQPEPEANLQLSRHFVNLFESPVLFYVVCVSALVLQHASQGFQLLAWGYVVSRVVHSVIHTGRNQLQPRIFAYFVSWIILLTLWLWLVLRVLANY